MFDAMLLLLSATVSQSASRLDAIKAAVEPILVEQAVRFNSSISFGFHDESGNVHLAHGMNDALAGTPVNARTLIPSGSATKTWTAVAIMQAVEAGLMSLDDLATKWVDPVLQRVNGTTLSTLWHQEGEGEFSIRDVTIRALLQHTSGIMEYDDFLGWMYEHPGEDLSPLDLLHLVPKHLVCDSTNCTCAHLDALPFVYYDSEAYGCAAEEGGPNVGFYTSIGYNILGLALVGVHALGDWRDLDQKGVIPPALAAGYVDTEFINGACDTLASVAHQYYSTPASYGDANWPVQEIVDIRRYSCLNGWTGGNLAASAGDLSRFFYELFTEVEPPPSPDSSSNAHNASVAKALATRTGFVTQQHLNQMHTAMVPNIVLGGILYGMGLYDNREALGVFGHGGSDYASSAYECGYNPAKKFGIAIMYNSNQGLNCSFSIDAWNKVFHEVALCYIFNAVFDVVGQPTKKADCTSTDAFAASWQSECVWMANAPSEGESASLSRGRPARRRGGAAVDAARRRAALARSQSLRKQP